MIRLQHTPTALMLVVDGPATMTESPAVCAAAADGLRRGARSLRLDLRACTAIDSTFSGTLLSLKRQVEGAGGTLTLVSPSVTVIDLLQKMGLEDFYAVESAEPLDGTWTELTLTRPSNDRLSRVVLDAHDQLARVPGPAGTAFRTVVEEMRRDEKLGRTPDGTANRPVPVH